jgi:hypothetical protein
MTTSILQVLEMLDPKVDDHWTKDGLPALAFVKTAMGDQDITRKQVTDAAPEFSRSHYDMPTPSKVEAPAEPLLEDDQGIDDETVETTFAPLEELAPVDPKQAEYNKVCARIAELQKEQEAIKLEIGQLTVVQGRLDPYVAKPGVKTAQQDQDSRMEFIRSQNELRAKKASQAQAMMKTLGVTSRAPIDEALGKKRSSNRPVFGQTVEG